MNYFKKQSNNKNNNNRLYIHHLKLIAYYQIVTLTRFGSTLALDACLGNLSSGSARNPAATRPDSVLFGAPPPPWRPPNG